MADENETEFEEEFDFESEDELLESAEDEFADTADYSGGGGGGKNLPPLPVLIGGGVGGVVLIAIIAMFAFGGDSEEEIVPVVEPEPIVQPTLPEPPPIVEEDPFGMDPGEPKLTLKNVVERIEAQEATVKKQIQALEMKLNELLSRLGKIDQQIGVATNDVATVSMKLEAINQELKMMQAPPEPVVKEKKVEPLSEAYTNPALTVHAIIPGRAWLKTRDGRTITVTEGDSIEDYGKVLAIDAPSGVVITSSGVILR